MMNRRTFLAMLLLITMVTGFLPLRVEAQTPTPQPHRAPMSAPLVDKLAAAAGPVSFLVILDEQVNLANLTASTAQQHTSVVERRAAIYRALTATALRTQAPLRAWLDEQDIPYEPFYLVNMIEVKGDLAIAEALRQRPEVARLALNPRVAQQHAQNSTPWQVQASDATQATAALPYGLTFTHADAVWAQGFRGAGIVVASQDTGVMWDHPALKDAYRGWNSAALTVTHPYSWLDAWGRGSQDAECDPDPQVPCDDGIDSSTHGSHTVGTMVGDATGIGNTVIGMAPEAQWIACRNMQDGFGTPAKYTTCFEFFLAPYPQGGDPFTDGDVAKAPNVINNSWGCPPFEGCDVDTLRQVVENVRAAGIFVAASAGNDGWGGACSSIGTPIGLYDASFTVGAHNSAGILADFSSRGPVTADGSNRLKPDITAPGVDVRSVGPDDSVNNMLSGTSMASPHLAGAVALLWSAVPALVGDIDRTEQILIRSARPVLTDECGDALSHPNNVYGYGWLDAAAAVQLAQQLQPLALATVGISGEPVSPTSAVLHDTVTGFDYPADAIQEAGAAWNSILPGVYELQLELSDGQKLNRTYVVLNEGLKIWLPSLIAPQPEA